MKLLIVNVSTHLSAADLMPMAAAIQRQVTEHLQPAWGVHSELQVANQGDVVPGVARVMVLDDSTDAGALGEHDFADAPTGFAAVKDALDDGVPFPSVLSHEILELTVDPDIIRLMRVWTPSGDIILPLEVSDAVEGATYKIDGVDVENFVLPAYYIKGAPPPYDHCGVLTQGAPALAPGGYGYTAKLGDWTQDTAEHARAAKRRPAPPWSRRGRR